MREVGEIEINPFKVIFIVRNKMFSKFFWSIWFFFVLIMVLFNKLAKRSNFITMDSFLLSDFFVPGITALSFTLALITATTRIFSKKQLVDIYKYTDKDNPKEGYLFYRTIAPYIWTSTVWMVVSIGALFAKMFVFNISPILHDVLRLIYSATVLMGIMSLWSLLIVHIKDVSLETEREVKASYTRNQKNDKS